MKTLVEKNHTSRDHHSKLLKTRCKFWHKLSSAPLRFRVISKEDAKLQSTSQKFKIQKYKSD